MNVLIWWILGYLTGGLGAVMLWHALIADRLAGGHRIRRCPACLYDMRGGSTLRCPECGKEVASEAALFRVRRRWGIATIGVGALIVGTAAAAYPLFEGEWLIRLPRTVQAWVWPQCSDQNQRQRSIALLTDATSEPPSEADLAEGIAAAISSADPALRTDGLRLLAGVASRRPGVLPIVAPQIESQLKQIISGPTARMDAPLLITAISESRSLNAQSDRLLERIAADTRQVDIYVDVWLSWRKLTGNHRAVAEWLAPGLRNKSGSTNKAIELLDEETVAVIAEVTRSMPAQSRTQWWQRISQILHAASNQFSQQQANGDQTATTISLEPIIDLALLDVLGTDSIAANAAMQLFYTSAATPSSDTLIPILSGPDRARAKRAADLLQLQYRRLSRDEPVDLKIAESLLPWLGASDGVASLAWQMLGDIDVRRNSQTEIRDLLSSTMDRTDLPPASLQNALQLLARRRDLTPEIIADAEAIVNDYDRPQGVRAAAASVVRAGVASKTR